MWLVLPRWGGGDLTTGETGFVAVPCVPPIHRRELGCALGAGKSGGLRASEKRGRSWARVMRGCGNIARDGVGNGDKSKSG